jgi:hypothetical protein
VRIVGIVPNSTALAKIPNIFLTTKGLQQVAYNGQPMVTSIGVVGTPRALPDGYQPLDADPELQRDGIDGQAWGETRGEVVQAMVASCAAALRWVVEQGVTFQPKVEGEQRGLVPAHCALSPPKDRGDARGWFDCGPHRALRVLQERFRRRAARSRRPPR